MFNKKTSIFPTIVTTKQELKMAIQRIHKNKKIYNRLEIYSDMDLTV